MSKESQLPQGEAHGSLGGSSEMNYSFWLSQSELLLRKKYKLLDNLEAQAEYGYPSVGEFTDSLLDHIGDKGEGVLEIIGESLSGKSFAASQWAGVMKESGITPVYIPWVDVIRDAKKMELIAKESKFGNFSPEEFQTLSDLYYILHEKVKETFNEQDAPFCVIGEAPGYPTLTADMSSILNRGTTAVRDLVRNHDAYVAVLFGSPGLRKTGKEFRAERAYLPSSDLIEKYKIVPQESNRDLIQEVLENTGAPLPAVESMEDQVNRTLFVLSNIAGSEKEMNFSLPSAIKKPEDFDKHPLLRRQVIGNTFVPFVLADLSVPQDKAFVGYNRKARGKVSLYPLASIHFHNYITL